MGMQQGRNDTNKGKPNNFKAWRNSSWWPGPSDYRGSTVILCETYTKISRTPLVEWSANCKEICLTTNNTQNRPKCMLSAGFELTTLEKTDVASVRLIPSGHQDQQVNLSYWKSLAPFTPFATQIWYWPATNWEGPSLTTYWVTYRDSAVIEK